MFPFSEKGFVLQLPTRNQKEGFCERASFEEKIKNRVLYKKENAFQQPGWECFIFYFYLMLS